MWKGTIINVRADRIIWFDFLGICLRFKCVTAKQINARVTDETFHFYLQFREQFGGQLVVECQEELNANYLAVSTVPVDVCIQ